MKLYLDTGVLAAYYTPDPRSAEVEELVRAYAVPAVSDLGELELLAWLERRVRRAELSAADARRVRTLFLSHLEAGLYTRLPLRRSHYRLARDWTGRGGMPLAPAESLHLAAAALAERTLVTTDRGLASAAGELGVEVLPILVADEEGMTVHEPTASWGAGPAATAATAGHEERR